MRPARIAVVGHSAYFSNHFPEGWRRDRNILCLDVDETDYSFLLAAANFKPDLTLFYRPELYPSRLVKQISGLKIALLSEPVPELRGGHMLRSSETELRLSVYAGADWNAFDRLFYYDPSKAEMIASLGWPITAYRPLPIDTSVFRPGHSSRPIDVCFVGKPTEHRVSQFDFLRSAGVRFVWIAHGVSGPELAGLFRRSKVVLNVHADALTALEPRVWLAAACGCIVLTEPLPEPRPPLLSNVEVFDGRLTRHDVANALSRYDVRTGNNIGEAFRSLSCRAFIAEQLVA